MNCFEGTGTGRWSSAIQYPLAMAGGGSSGLTGHEVPRHGGWNEGPGEVGEVAGVVSA